MKPDMTLVRSWAKKYKIPGKIEESEKKKKKLKVMHEGRWIHFGHPEYEDVRGHNIALVWGCSTALVLNFCGLL